ncbi:MAG: ATP-binding cassette domain-containing protein [Chloroflexi bacterium]|nr:ATP-binding cassette domain-containing protein [Chloroflexota bacterium]MCL5075262.1 ATP-binding cassette domain-containing protein [Chloroflexota bacterium]
MTRTGNTDHTPILEVEGLKVYFPIKGGLLARQIGLVRAVDGVSFTVTKGETLGLVGESGCGKTTLGRAILRLVPLTAGAVRLEGEDLARMDRANLRQNRHKMQMIFQDPAGCLDPRMTVGEIIGEPLENFAIGTPRERSRRIQELLNMVGLHPGHRNYYPHQMSGGMRQRVGIARALAPNPVIIVADEPVSALDVSIQSQILNLLKSLQEQLNLTYLFIAHNLSVVKHVSDRVAVMYLGRIVEISDSEVLYNNPMHPYTQSLFSAIPIPDPEIERRRKRILLEGEVPSPLNPPPGCRFHPRCYRVQNICREQLPELVELEKEHYVACHYP